MIQTPQRKVFDQIYGYITFPQQIWDFIDTPHFQRLRNIKQLGCLSWIFPGAVHTRFQHSLGTGHLAQKYITTLIHNHSIQNRAINQKVYQDYYGQFSQKQFKIIFTVTLAGLLHDVGHGPYSHLFDTKVVHKVNDKYWEHEIASLCLIDKMYQHVLNQETYTMDKSKRQWLESTRNRVKSLIIGKIHKTKYIQLQRVNGQRSFKIQKKEVDNLQPGFIQIFKKQLTFRPWEFEIVSNRLTGIDVDKLDYFRRDAHYLGSKNIFIEHQLLMNETFILQDFTKLQQSDQRHRLCYPSKYSAKVYDVYYSRYKLYKTYYENLKSISVGFMVADILKKSETIYHFKQTCKQLLEGSQKGQKGYVRLTDSILQKIEDLYQDLNQGKNQKDLTEQQIQNIMDAGQIIKKLRQRKIYNFAKEYHRGYTFKQMGIYDQQKKQIKQLIEELNQFYPNQIAMNSFEIGFGIKDKDPFDQCKFYDKYLPIKEIESSNKKHFSMLRPPQILELYFCYYFKKSLLQQQKIEIETQILRRIEQIDTSFVSSSAGNVTQNRYQPGQQQRQQQQMNNQNLRQMQQQNNDVNGNL